jgi:hypothetical protein
MKEFVGWTPRYVEATNELFFCSARLSPAGNMDIWVIRNFDPLPNALDRSDIRGSENTQGFVPRSEAVGTVPIVKDLGAFTMTKDGRSWNVIMPQQFTKAEVIFYRGAPSDLTLNAAWKGHLQINGKDVVQFKKRSEPGVWLFHDFTTGADYKETYEYQKDAPRRYIDVTKYLHSGDNSFYFYHEQGRDHSFYYYHEEGRNVPMGVILRITQ